MFFDEYYTTLDLFLFVLTISLIYKILGKMFTMFSLAVLEVLFVLWVFICSTLVSLVLIGESVTSDASFKNQ